MRLFIAPVSTLQFHVDNDAKAFIGDISETNGFQPLYDDACDVGITLQSAKSLRYSSWYVEREEYGDEFEISNWILKPTTETLRHLPGLEGWKIVLYND